jgi:hypothetical protein
MEEEIILRLESSLNFSKPIKMLFKTVDDILVININKPT